MGTNSPTIIPLPTHQTVLTGPYWAPKEDEGVKVPIGPRKNPGRKVLDFCKWTVFFFKAKMN